MTWVGDEQYVKSGQSATVRIDHNLIAPLTTLQYFPHQKKNCYSFPGVGQGLKILVRAWFYYGNYDGLSSPPTFDLLFNGNSWGRVSLSEDKYNGSAIFEVVHVTKVDDVSVCLVRTNPNDVPFINSLEIKQLDQGMYHKMNTNRPLYLKGRYAYALSANYIRHPDDPYDRLWLAFTDYASSGLSPVRRSSDPSSNLLDKPPAAVLRQAITPSSSVASNMTVPNLITSTSPLPHYVTFYFVEMLPDANRSFDIYLDDQQLYPETIVPGGTVLEFYHSNISLSTSSVFSLVRAKGSTLPPLISAAEFYMIGPVWGVAATDSSDVNNPRLTVLPEQAIKHEFSHAEIVEITNNFETVIGEGGSGNVYHGRLNNGPEVAVKVLKDSLERGTKEFVAEVKLLMTVHHKCLVSFIGYCEEDGKLILLYEYMSGGNLRQLLSGRRSTSVFLTWETRLQMALSVATGLDYLHSGCYPAIIHRDVKTTNILLNEKMEAKVADFGLSKFGHKDDVTMLPTVVAGTPGYIDPEYYSTNMVTKKSDVYSFGVVLFELITGYPPLFDVSKERVHIVQWATSRLTRGDIDSVADPRLRGQYEVNSMRKVADIAMSCTAPSSKMRPRMSDVVNQLKEAIEAETHNQHKANASCPEVPHSSSSYGFSSSTLPEAR
ncbi:Receptor-like protein kinase [Nymphaea thermarum]|nr:Receptor-like protein kinase [Nymphaea thermarum]